MKPFIWLASYPKSGNTWMRALLTNYRNNREQPANINNLYASPFTSLREHFDDYLGLDSSDLNVKGINRYRPGFYRFLANEFTEPVIVKIHDACFNNELGEAIIPPDVSQGVIYLIRNPLDIAISYAHHENCEIDMIIERMNDTQHSLFNKPGRLDQQLPQRLGTWSEHVQSWMALPVKKLVIRYEDLLSDTVTQFKKVIDFINWEYDAYRLTKAVEFSSFKSLKLLEDQHGFAERQATATSFFWGGKSMSHDGKLTNAQKFLIIQSHKEVMIEYGYYDLADNI